MSFGSVFNLLRELSWVGLSCFLVAVCGIAVARSRHLFFKLHGWTHRFSGALLLIWLLLGTFTCSISSSNVGFAFWYDVVLGILGIVATLTAAKAFPHKLVKNEKGLSGTLHQNAIVTQGEMIEHAFYQALNLMQALYLHMIQRVNLQRQNQQTVAATRMLLLFLVTCPWLIRHKLPVHSFSGNWTLAAQLRRGQASATTVDANYTHDPETRIYMVKKSQYLFYKHVILHGFNIYMATNDAVSFQLNAPPYSLAWRVFWILLNTSYVMEFFLQTLVKRRNILKQSTMLLMQQWLMIASSLGATVVLGQTVKLEDQDQASYLLPAASTASLILNFANRHHDTLNTMLVALALRLIAR